MKPFATASDELLLPPDCTRMTEPAIVVSAPLIVAPAENTPEPAISEPAFTTAALTVLLPTNVTLAPDAIVRGPLPFTVAPFSVRRPLARTLAEVRKLRDSPMRMVTV